MKRMLTREDYKKLGIPYVTTEVDINTISSISNQLNSRINNLRSILSILVTPPISSESPGKKGYIAVDDEYFYICTDLNTWKRIPLSNLNV
jgi:hypothetical protein